MKTKYIKLLWVFALSLAFGFVSCSSDDDPIVDETTLDLTLSETKVDIVVGEATSVSISKGNGDYKAFSLNEEVATVELVGDELQLTGISSGETAIIVSDKDSQYKRVEVRSIYDKLIVEDNNVEMKIRLGNSGKKTITILGGNGSYKAMSSDESIATATVSGDNVIVTGHIEGSAIITVTDRFDVQTEITVAIATTTVAYEGEELEELLNNDTATFFFDGVYAASYYDFINSTEGEYNVIGWDFWGYYDQKIYFKGEKTVGKKEGAYFSENDWGGAKYDKEPINLEILKVENNKIWGMFSFIKNDKLLYGHFVIPM